MKSAIWLTACTSLFASFAAAVSNFNEPPTARPAEALYLRLSNVGLDPARVYRIREATLDRPSLHISLEDGTIAFTQDVMGRITGAFFEGYGEVLLVPPNDVERKSMSLFTGMAILEARFSTAYFRFNDETALDLGPDLRAAENAKDFVAHWDETARNLAQADAMRLLISFSRLLPAEDGKHIKDGLKREDSDRLLHARLQSTTLGIFDVYFDSTASEQIQAGQAKSADDGNTYYDVWASFALDTAGSLHDKSSKSRHDAAKLPGEKPLEEPMVVRRYAIVTEVKPPKDIHATARLELELRQEGTRILVFELSRFLQVESVEMDGHTVEFIHNPAVEGTQLSRRGNDLVAVILPQPAKAGQKMELRFVYGGEVLAEAGSGLLYVGARGTWYPNRGLAMADFDLEFRYPPGWTLVATGKPAAVSDPASHVTAGEQVAGWVSDRPIPVAGFNLGKYKVATTQAGNVLVEAYAAGGVERDFPSAQALVIPPTSLGKGPQSHGTQIIVPRNPSPAHNELAVAAEAAQAIQYYAARFGAYPYSRLALTQMPGRESQGWPGLVFLSSYAFLTAPERAELHFDPLRVLLQQQITAHEVAHQWWGDLITWKSYRDQWFSEGLANYCALMILQENNPAAFHEVMDKYRRDLIAKEKEGDDLSPKDAGPVTLGGRLLSSRFPGGYEAISYGRGTWLFHMLRTMMQDAAGPKMGGQRSTNGSDEPFVRALRRLRERYEGKSLSTRELLDVFAEDLPPALRYENQKSLDWFLEGWVNGTALPKLELKAVKFIPKAAGSTVAGTIIQKDAPVDLVTSVPVYGLLAGKRQVLLGRVFADGEETPFHLQAPAGVRKIVLDPEETILTNPK